MRSTTAASRHSISRLCRVKSFVDLADSCAFNIKLKLRWEISGKRILSGLDVFQSFNNSCRLLCDFIVRCVHRDWRYCNSSLAGVINARIRLCGRNFIFNVNIFPNANNDDSMPCLWNAIILKLIKIWIQFVSSLTHFIKDFGERLTIICIFQAADILGQKPFRVIKLQNFHTIGIQRSINTIHAFLLAHNTIIIAREAKGQCINVCQMS